MIVAVVPARRAERTILATIEALRLGNDPSVERVLVVTSRGDPTADVVRAWAKRDRRVGLVLAEQPQTAGAARNLGREAARCIDLGAPNARARESEDAAPLLLFVDADCRLEPGGAARLAADLEIRRADAIGARILGEGGIVSRVRHMLEFKEAASRREPPAEWLLPSTTLLVRAEAFDRVGGFPDLWPGEDLVFTRRLRDLGGAARRSAHVRSFHRHPDGAAEMLRHQHRLGRTAAKARRLASMHGEVFTRSRWLALLLFPGRLLRIAGWQLREGIAGAAVALALSPLLVAGLAAWTLGFASASGRPAPSTSGRERPGPWTAREAESAT